MNVRSAKLEDAESIALLHAESWRVAYRGIFRDEFLDGDVIQDRKDTWRQRFTTPKNNQIVFVAEDNQELCGFACAFGNEDKKWGTFIDNLHVRKNRKRQGIGTRLITEIVLWSRQHYPGLGLYLDVLEENIPARRFYEALGAINQESRLWEPPGGGEVVDLRYVWLNVEPLLSGNVG
ncbi:MAG: GNAT family N-acetyltransferase [Betaproteobacteria bacterium]|nr:GNAT family N-acetyltransferase [Betaproteobacteria bacterium]